MAESGAHTTGLSEMQQRLREAATSLPQAFARILFQRLNEAVAYARTNYLTGGTTAERLAVRTGALRASFGAEVQLQTGGAFGRLGFILPQVGSLGREPLVYARTHEYGATIRPVNAKYLAIPLAAAKTGAGVPRGRPRDFPNTFVRRARGGALLIFQQVSKTTIQPLFLLKTQVTIPPRPALAPTVQWVLPQIRADANQAIQRYLGG
jgi:hypothetical protein